MTTQTQIDELAAEVDRFRAPGGVRKLVVGSLLFLIYSVPLIQAGIEIAESRTPRFLEVFTRAPSRANLRTYETDLENALFLAKSVRPWVQYVWFRLFEYAGEKVIVGRDNWLFYKQDVDYLVRVGRQDAAGQAHDGHTSGKPDPDDPLTAIVDFRDQLLARGIRLVVVPVPGKPSVHPEKATAGFRGVMRSPTLDLIARMRQQGVEVVDLFALFAQWRGRDDAGAASGALYLLTDTHWSGTTARLAAEEVARRIRDLNLVAAGARDFAVQPLATYRTGDISRMIPVPGLETRYPAERVVVHQVIQRDSGELYTDDPASPVLVLGDSFSRIYESDEPRAAGFIAHLASFLRMPVMSIVNDGGASTLVRQELSRKPELLDGKKVVIWEFVERDIAYGAEGWTKVALGPVVGTPSGMNHAAASDQLAWNGPLPGAREQ